MSRGNVVKNSLRVDAAAHMTAEGALNVMQDSLHQWWMGDLTNHRRVQARRRQSFETARAPRGSSAEYWNSSSPVEDMRKRLRELRAPVWSTTTQRGVVCWREKRSSVNTRETKRCWTDDVTWRTRSTQPYQGPRRDSRQTHSVGK